MGSWKESLAKANSPRTMDRARASIGRNTIYDLGEGGYDPTAPLTRRCDCSGFVAWCIGIPRELPPGSNKWLDTDAYWRGGVAGRTDLFPPVPPGSVQPGDIIVYPDGSYGEGHMGIITSVQDGEVIQVIHCSASNWRNHGDAILETEPGPWQNPHRNTRLVRTNYAKLRQMFGLAEEVAIGGADVGAHAPILHPLLSNDPALQRVAGGLSVLTPTGDRVAGIGTVQDALGVLSRGHPEYSIDLGPNRRYRGFYGPKTSKAVREFQMDVGLPQTGEVDVDTLVWLSRALQEWRFEARTDSTAADTGEIELKLRNDGRDWYATPQDGTEFFVGREVIYKERYGLMNSHHKHYTQWYDPEASYAQSLGHWRYVMYPTVMCESDGLMACINTYDRAFFTFGFYQFAAHVPDGDFVRFLRSLLRELDNAPRYFPNLTLNEGGHIARRVGSALRDLEEVVQGMPMELMRYLNPSDREVEDAEVLNAARFIHWCETHEEVRQLMLAEAVSTAKEKLIQQNRARPFKLTKHPDPLDTMCVAIIDILHHEGSKFAKVDDILKSEKTEDKALVALCHAGVDEKRNQKLLKNIRDLKERGNLGTKRLSDLTG